MSRKSQSFAKTTDGRWLKDREDYHKAIAQSRYLGIRSDLIEVLISWFGDALRHKKGYTKFIILLSNALFLICEVSI